MMTSWTNKLKQGDVATQRLTVLGTRALSELTSTSAMLGVAYAMENVYEAKPVKNVLSKVISPFISVFDWGADRLTALETDKETEIRKNSPQEQRAYIYADAIVDLGAKVLTNGTVQLVTTQLANNALLGDAAPTMQETGLSMAADRAVNWGSIVLLNTIFATQNEKMQESLQPMIQTVTGMNEADSRMMARDAINMHIPNMAGALTSLAVLFHSVGNGR